MSKQQTAVFFLKLSHTQSRENIKSDAFRYCSQNALSIAHFLSIKEDPDNTDTCYALWEISRICDIYPEVILYTNSELPCLDHFPLVRQALIDGVLTIRHWNC